MGKIIYVDFFNRKRVNDEEVRDNLILGSLERYRDLTRYNVDGAYSFAGHLFELYSSTQQEE